MEKKKPTENKQTIISEQNRKAFFILAQLQEKSDGCLMKQGVSFVWYPALLAHHQSPEDSTIQLSD